MRAEPRSAMNDTKPRARGFRRSWPLIVMGVMVLAGLSFGAYTSFVLEESDVFCISCHTAPEQVYFDRARQAEAGSPPVDLASLHMKADDLLINCIACHRGTADVGDRIQSVALGARDTLIHLAGRADPGIEKRRAGLPDLIDRSCVACHVEAIVVASFENHFHVKLPATWAALERGAQPVGSPEALVDNQAKPEPLATTVTCLSCHIVHASGFELTGYLDESGAVFPACNQCHVEVNRGPKGLTP